MNRGPLSPPVAAIRPHEVHSPHGVRVDDYYWLRDDTRTSPDVLAYLLAENAYREAMTASLQPLEAELYREIVGRIRQDDSSVPYRDNGWWYLHRYGTGDEYPVYARRAGRADGPEQVLLDLRENARGLEYYDVGSIEVSHDNRLLAFTEDVVGRRQYRLRFKSLVTGELLPDVVPNVEEGVVWAADNRRVLYVEKDPVTLLGLRVRAHELGTDPALDPVVHEEDDEAFYTSVGLTKDRRYLLIDSSSTVTTEVRYAPVDDSNLTFTVFLPRSRGHEYSVDHVGERWVIRSNWQAVNFRLFEASAADTGRRERWRELVAHRDDVLVAGFDVFDNFLAVEERVAGLRKVRIRPWAGGREFHIDSDEPAYRMALDMNEEVDSEVVRYTYTSLTTPRTTYDYDTRTGERVLLKREPVLGDFDPSQYETEYRWVPARDGERVPVAIVYRRSLFRRDGSAPLLQYGYGAYGISSDPLFSSSVLSLLDRGFVYAIAQVRGGQERGRRWYDAGRLLQKQHSFEDFIDATRWLVAEGYADAKRVFARGGSAGGLLVAAAANMAPGLYRGIVAHVPFVDIVTSMLDESIPLTTNEYDEWGDPNERAFYDCMLSYSPYDNVTAQEYPALYVTTGLWDSQVQYYEPAKWVAKLRRLKTDDRLLVMRVNMEAGHGGKSGRFEHLHEVAEEYAFMLDQAGLGRK
ncbi:MAG: S9 family peptidase [Steroidobacteraceae bacterium]|nr:S9 family peptidase [Steroidobacteraceae bacterium]MBP7012277.1 S9 family peptidase [Steroidobacteraceae bacterium]